MNNFSRSLEALAAVALAGIVVVLVINMTTRFFGMGALPWTEELARFLMITMVFLGIAAVLDLEAHISVDFFTDLLPPKWQTPVLLLGKIVTLGFALILLYSAASLLWGLRTNLTPGLRMPTPIFYGSLAVGGLAFALSAARAVWRYIVHARGETANDITGNPR